MGMFDLTTEPSFNSGRTEADERAISALLKSPALSYLRDLRRTIDQDPVYLVFHDKSVSLRVQSLLARQGILVNDEGIERQCMRVVMEAVCRLRSIER